MADESNHILEIRLRKEIAEINTAIEEMIIQRRGLENLLLKARREEVVAKEVTRKNSVNRILVEANILDALGRGTAVTHRRLLSNASAEFYFLKPITFRSYLRRMKERGLIEGNGNRGWRLKNIPNKKGGTTSKP